MTLKNRLNPELGHLISILNSYPDLKPKIDNLVEKVWLWYTQIMNIL